MAALGSLVVKLALEYAEYTKGLDKSSQEALKFSKGIQTSFDNAASSTKEFFVGMASGALAAGTAFLSVRTAIDGLTNSIATLEKLDDMAQKTGSSVENLSRIQKTVQAFGGDFNAVDTAISKLAKGMATVDSDTNKANNALRALGVSSRDTAGNLRDPSEVMIEIAKRLQNYSDGAGKAALVTDLFGKSGADMLPVLNDIADNFDRFTGVTAESAAAAARFKDQLGQLSVASTGLFDSLASDLLPTFSKVITAMTGSAERTAFFSSAVKIAGSMIEQLVIMGAASRFVFTSLGKTVGTAGEQLLALSKLDFRGIREAGVGLVKDIAKDYAEYDKFVVSILAGNAKVEKSAASVSNAKPQLNYLSGNDAAAKAAAQKIESLNDASRKYLETLKVETLGVGANTIQTKMLAAAKQAAITPSKQLAAEIMAQAQAWAKLTQFQEDVKTEFDALQEREDWFFDATNAVTDYARAVENSNEGAQFEIDLMGKSAAERDIALAQRQAELELKKQILAITDQVINADDRSALIEEANAIGERAIAAARLQAMAKTTQAEWARIGTTIEQTGKMAFVQFATHGVSAMKSIGEAIKLSIMDLLYQLTVRKFVIHLEASLASTLASSAANAAGSAVGGNSFNLMNLASGAQSLFSAFTGGASSLVSAIGTSAIGQAMGLGVAGGSAVGAGVGAGAGAGTAFIGGAGTALGGAGATTAGLSAAGTMLAAAAGPLAIAAAADMVWRLIAGNKTIKGAEALTYVPVIGPMINALFGMGPKKLGTPELTGKFSDTGFNGQFEADWKRSGGIFAFGKKKGRRGLGISGEQDAALDAMVGEISDVFLDLTKVTGDAERSLNGWSMSFRHAIDTEERQKRLTDELTASIGTKLIPELTLIQQKGETLADTAARASAEFSLMNSVIDLTGQSFGAIGLASLGLRDSLVQLLGGLENAGSVLQPFFDNFYTDAERVASTGRLMNAELNKLGVTVIPTTREQFRSLVEAQDLSTDAGQEMFAALIQLAPAFATVTDAIGKAADDAAAEAQRIADSIQLLTTDAFATLFDYTKYIRLAANAGVTAAQPAGPVFQAQAQVFRPSFAVGTNEVPSDMTANIHRGERIIPAADNRELMRRLAEPNEGMRIMADEIKQLRAELKAQGIAQALNTGKIARNTEKSLRLSEEQDISGLLVRTA